MLGFFRQTAGAVTILVASLTPSLTENAIANGDTRTINLFHAHTKESISATYLVNGQYDPAVLKQLNWFLRDWRRDEPTEMDPRLFDVVWETYRHAGAATETINVVSAYRSPETNAMLRRRSRAVAKYSQHMLGKAMDTTMPGMPMSRIREIGMRMQRGGVGYYPTAGTPFVHLDVGNVRHWPRMSYEQLVTLFPDGKTVHIPTNGQPLARYEEARAEIEARNNGAYVTAPKRGWGIFAWLFGGGGADEDEDAGYTPPSQPAGRKQWASLAPRGGKGGRNAAADMDEEGGGPAPAEQAPARSEALARAEANLPRGETVMSAAPAEATPEQPAKPDTVSFRHVPLPPTKPASIARLAAAQEAIASQPQSQPQAQQTEAPPQDPRVTLAALEPQAPAAEVPPEPAPPQQAARQEPAETPKLSAVVAPLPPRRPTNLAALSDAVGAARTGGKSDAKSEPKSEAKSDAKSNTRNDHTAHATAPLPPTRPNGPKSAGKPKDASPSSAIANLVDKHAPHGAKAGGKTGEDSQVPLAYAPAAGRARTQNSAKTEVAPPRINQANAGATPASRASGGSVIGAPLGGVRSAARAASGFAQQNSAPPTDKFSAGR